MRELVTRRTVVGAGAILIAAPWVARAQQGPVKIGLIHPVTGSVAYNGTLCRMGGVAAIEDINAEGGLKALGGAKIEGLVGDAQGRPEIGASLVDQMAEQGVVGFTGCYSSPIALAATQAAAKYGLPFCIDSGLADSITGRGLKNVFRLFPAAKGTSEDAMATLDAINKKAGSPAKTAIVVHEDGEFGTNNAKLLQVNLEKIGIKLIDTIPHATPTRDFTNIALRIKSAKPDLLIPSNYVNEYMLLARTIVQQKIDLVAVYSVAGGGFNLPFTKSQPTAAESIIDFNHWLNPKSPKAPAFRKRFEDKGTPFSYELLFGYFAVRYLVDAMERAGSTDKDKIIEALATSTFGSDLLTFGPTKMVGGQNQNAHASAQQALKGDIKVVAPEPFAEVPAVFPRPKA